MRGLLIGMLAFGSPASAVTQATSLPVGSTDVAVTVAEAMAPREQMRGLILATMARTTTRAIIDKTLGNERATALLRAETDKVVDRYGAEWASLLASSYRETLTAEELGAAQSAFKTKDRAAMMPLMQRVGPVMQQKAAPLLQRASTEALAAAYDQMMKETAR